MHTHSNLIGVREGSPDGAGTEIFDSSPTHELIEELGHKANFFVARKVYAAMPDKAFLRRQAVPNSRRLQSFVDRMNRLGFDIDPTSSGTLQASLFKIEDIDLRKVRKKISTTSGKFLLIILSRVWKLCCSKQCNAPSTLSPVT